MYPEIKFNEEITIEIFSILVTLGVVVMILMFMTRAIKKYHYNEMSVYFAVQMLMIALVVGYVGAIFFDALFKIPDNGEFVLKGATFYGGLIAGVPTFVLLMSLFDKSSTKTIDWLNILAPCMVIGHMFGRIGCFLGGCCYGKETDSWLGVTFPHGSPAHTEHGGLVNVFPTQLFEAVGLFIIFIIMVKIVKKNQFIFYLISYGITRFIIEFFRGDDRGSLFVWLSPAQTISLLLIGLGITMSILDYKKNHQFK